MGAYAVHVVVEKPSFMDLMGGMADYTIPVEAETEADAIETIAGLYRGNGQEATVTAKELDATVAQTLIDDGWKVDTPLFIGVSGGEEPIVSSRLLKDLL